MKYTFINDSGNEQTINVPDDYISRNTKLLNITEREAIEMYLSDEGYVQNEVVVELTQKAAGMKNRVNSGKTQKKRERKPDEAKRALIKFINENIIKFPEIDNVQVENIERIISFTLGDDTYNITLSKKRKPKD